MSNIVVSTSLIHHLKNFKKDNVSIDMKDTGDSNVDMICQKLKTKHTQYKFDNGNLREEVRKALTDNNFNGIAAASPTVSHDSSMSEF